MRLFIFYCGLTRIFLRANIFLLKYLLLIFCCCFLNLASFAQADTTISRPPAAPLIDTVTITGDTLLLASDTVKKPVVVAGIDSLYKKLLDNPYLQMKDPPVYLVIKERVREEKDGIFYMLAGLLLLLAFIKLLFPKYFLNVFRLFFQPAFRQKQTREQLLQSALPSLLLNLFFILSGGAYLALLLNYYQLVNESFWLLFLYGSISLLILYAGKYVFLSFAGWVFNIKQAAETYTFMVFLINKLLGVLLVPVILIIAFSDATIINVAITISMLLIGTLFVYRFVVSYTPVRREVKVSRLHFLFYVLAFELTPLLLIYKTLIIYMDKSL